MRNRIIIASVIVVLILSLCYIFRPADKPCIPVSENLEIYLGFDYPNYVDLLNQSCKKDTASMIKFLKTNSIEGADGYDHGSVLCDLMEKVGDEFVLSSLKKLSNAEIKNLIGYLSVGLDGFEGEENCEFAKRHMKSITYLNKVEKIYTIYDCTKNW